MAARGGTAPDLERHRQEDLDGCGSNPFAPAQTTAPEPAADPPPNAYPDPPLQELPTDGSEGSSSVGSDCSPDGSARATCGSGSGSGRANANANANANATVGPPPLVPPPLLPPPQPAPAAKPTGYVDNSRHRYVPIRLRCGSAAFCRPTVLRSSDGLAALSELDGDLAYCMDVLPPAARGLVRRTRFYLNEGYRHGPAGRPRSVQHMVTHHGEGWLRAFRDDPGKVHGIEIYSVGWYRAMRLHWNGPGLVLHEMCHLIHQFALEGGLDDAATNELYSNAVGRKEAGGGGGGDRGGSGDGDGDGGRYDLVLRRDWAGRSTGGDMDRHYGTVNEREFFAEMSVAFLAGGYEDLDDGTAAPSMEACSPPLMSPDAIDRVRRAAGGGSSRLVVGTAHLLPWHRRLLSAFTGGRDDSSVPGQGLPHCNKFYPFTRKQLEMYDPDVYRQMALLWERIGQWDDPHEDALELVRAPTGRWWRQFKWC